MPRTKEQFEEIREKTRGLILKHSLKLFAETGYAGTSMNDIAKSAGISKGLAYNYFESKQEIAQAIMHEAFREFEEMGAIFKQMEDPFEAVKQFITFSFNMIEKDPEKYRLFMMFAMHSEMFGMARDVIGEFYKQFYKEFEKLFRKMGVKNPKTEAMFFGAAFDGIFLNHIFFSQDYPVKSLKKLLLKKYSREGIEKLQK